jgi:hypothetical protein
MSRTSVHASPSSAAGVTRSTASILQRQTTSRPHVCIQREASGSATHAAAPSLVREVVESPGQPLDARTRSSMEPHLGHDLSQVRVHTDDRAAESARAVSANAYTAGTHVAFATGRYSPSTAPGRQLLAHELTHVVQQARQQVPGAPMGDGLSVSHPSDSFEREARQTSSSMMTDRDIGMPAANSVSLPAKTPTPMDTRIQRDDNDTVAAGTLTGGIGGGLSGIGAIVGLFAAFRSAKAAEVSAEEAKKQTGIAGENLDIARETLANVENPPLPAPLTGGLLVNNAYNGYPDIPSSKAPTDSTAKKAESMTDRPVPFLKVLQPKNSATFSAVIKSDGKSIEGGYFQDEVVGYLGGTLSANLNLTLKARPGSPQPISDPSDVEDSKPAPKGKKSKKNIASVDLLISGNQLAGRTKQGTVIQHFSGAVTIPATGAAALHPASFIVQPGGPVPAGTGPVTVELKSDATPSGVGVSPTPPAAKEKAGGGTTK